MTATVRIGWIGRRRQMTYVTGPGIDISEHGLAVRIPRPLPMGTLVHLELAGCGMSAAGRVRYAIPDGTEWRLGIETSHLFPSDAA
jgi:hypothetical protein